MDDYTSSTKDWLDERFQKTNEAGIYQAHQPIYGFRRGHCESSIVQRYAITCEIVRVLSHLRFGSLLDVGGAEGYKAALIRSIFGVEVRSCDLSREACKRAQEIFDVKGEPVDILDLPYDDNAFDVVLCSETLEHVPDIWAATKELLRVSRKALVVTVPHEPQEVIERNIREEIPHAHLHSLDVNSFEFCRPLSDQIIPRKFLSPFMRMPFLAMDGTTKEHGKEVPSIIVDAYNILTPVIRALFGKRTASALIHLDRKLANMTPYYNGISFVIVKNTDCYSKHALRRTPVSDIMDFRVPYYFLHGRTPNSSPTTG